MKYSFFYSCSVQFVSLITPQTSGTAHFVDTIISSVPTKVAGYLGILYGVAIVVKKGSEAWKAHLLHKYEVKKAKQQWQMGEMDNAKKKKDYDL